MDDIHHKLLSKVSAYGTPPPAVELLKQSPPLIIAAASASGKNTVADYILERANYREVVSHTTRQPREGEINGQHYWFVDETKMLELVTAEAFIEVQAIHGETVYGTTIEAYRTATTAGHQPLLVMDVQGVVELMRHISDLKPYFILPPNYDEWMQRLHKRGAISHVEKQQRLDSARKELETALKEHFIFVVNRHVDEAAGEIMSGSTDMHRQEESRKIAEQLLLAIEGQ